MSTIKVTPEQLHHVSNQVDQARQQLEHIQDNLSRQIMFLQAVWLGVTQERFYGDFARSRPVLQKALESMLYTSKELTNIATRFEQTDAEKGSLGGVIGAVGAAAMMKSSGNDAGSEDKGYRMAQVNVFGKLVHMPVNEDGVTDQAALQAYQKDQGHLDFNRMQAVGTEEPGEDIFALQIEAFENRIHPFTGEPVNDRYAQMMVTSLKFSQVLMAFQMVRGSMPGRKGPFRLPSSHPAVAKLKKNLEDVKNQKPVIEEKSPVIKDRPTQQLSQNLIDHVINRHSVNSTKQQLPFLQKKMSDEQINEMLSRKSFFNKEWSDKRITDASTEAVNQLKQQGVKDGLHTVTVFDESIKVFIRNDNVDSIYGTHKYKISDLKD
ncbi:MULTISPECIES: WXG100 family type VII secretion target [Paenibacillus]|uniref:WXG100 family type VII secretion target n=1 Tax=Paenibacillus TaxID=44249 RepID=UPI0012B6DBBC|nr:MULTISPECIES: WXG100 family type VII secretion target [Paenibacillus]